MSVAVRRVAHVQQGRHETQPRLFHVFAGNRRIPTFRRDYRPLRHFGGGAAFAFDKCFHDPSVCSLHDRGNIGGIAAERYVRQITIVSVSNRYSKRVLLTRIVIVL